MDNYYGKLVVPGLGISFEQFILILYPALLVPVVYFWLVHLKARRRAEVQPAGCVKLGVQRSLNSMDQYESKHDGEKTGQAQGKVKMNRIRPIESCASVELGEAETDGSGVVWDRIFCFAERVPLAPSGARSKEASQTHEWTVRTLQTSRVDKLAFVRPEVWVPKISPEDPNHLRRANETGLLVVKYPNISTGSFAFLDNMFIRWGFLPRELSFQVPLVPPSGNVYPREILKLQEEEQVWFDMTSHLPDSFKTYIDAENTLTLLRVDPDVRGHSKGH